MRLLFLTSEIPFPPSHGGAKLRNFQMIKELSKEHEVFLLSFVENSDEAKLVKNVSSITSNSQVVLRKPKKHPPLIHYIYNPFWFYESEEMAKVFTDTITNNEFDIVQFDFPKATYVKYCPKSIHKILSQSDSQTIFFKRKLRI